jgi:beta-galactosidase
VLCLDARNLVRFSLAGSGRLIDNLGISTGSRVVQLYNGRARITLERNGSMSAAGVTSDGIVPAFATVSA